MAQDDLGEAIRSFLSEVASVRKVDYIIRRLDLEDKAFEPHRRSLREKIEAIYRAYALKLQGSTPEEKYLKALIEEYSPLDRVYSMPINKLKLPVRASNSLEAGNIQYVGELVQMSEKELIAMRNFGSVSLKKIKKILKELHPELKLGMKIDYIPPEKRS